MRYLVDEYYDDGMSIIDDYEDKFSFITKVLPKSNSFMYIKVPSGTHDYMCFEKNIMFKIPHNSPFGGLFIEELEIGDAYLFPDRKDDAEAVAEFVAKACGTRYVRADEFEFLEMVDKFDDLFPC